MNRQRTLILGQMPPDATPRSHLAAGPWCFAQREELFPDWETRFTFGAEPLTAPEALETAARQAMALTAHSIPDVAAALCPHAANLPRAYWDMALGIWLIMVSQQLVERALRARALVEQWGQEPLLVPLLPESCLFRFASEQDYILGGALDHQYNHWLLSQMLDPIWPAAWEKVWLPPVHTVRSADAPTNFGKRLRGVLRRGIKDLLLALPFPPVKGFSPLQCLKFSLALRRNRNTADQSRLLDAETGPLPTLPCAALPLILASLPESLRQAGHPRRLTPAARPRTRVAHICACEETAYRLRLARWRGRGHKLVFIQHGGNYGHIRTDSMDPVMEYCQHAFLTWGWERQTPQRGNFLPLPHAQPAALRDAHTGRDDTLLYVGTEMPVFPYRMDSRLTPLQYVQYRDDKQWFFEALPRDIHKKCLYRPYFPLPGTLDDAQWLLPRFPHVRLCVGPLDPHMLGCRLLVLDHHGTTLELAMAANVPTLLFWNREGWGLCPESLDDLAALEAAGIWHPTAESAAMHLRRVWDDVPGWWRGAPVQAARARWCRHHVRLADGPLDPLWIDALKTL